MVESTEVEPQIQRNHSWGKSRIGWANCKLYIDFRLCGMSAPLTPHVVQGCILVKNLKELSVGNLHQNHLKSLLT